jgi:hypothetical protein
MKHKETLIQGGMGGQDTQAPKLRQKLENISQIKRIIKETEASQIERVVPTHLHHLQ